MNHPNGKTVSIYILRDPDTGCVRYVGWAVVAHRRLLNHINCAKRRVEKNHRSNWIRSLLAQGKSPEMEVIETGVVDFAARERWWIAYYRSVGAPLTNGTDGGEGMLGHVPSAEQRKRMSEQSKGRLPSIPAGWKHTQESLAKISAIHKGKKLTAENKTKLSVISKARALTNTSEYYQNAGKARRIQTQLKPQSACYRLERMKKSGRWKLIERIEGPINKWKCVCECGTERIVNEQNLARGGSLSCGCLTRESLSMAKKTHGESIAGSVTNEYRSWRAMIQRCCNPNYPVFADYGARGITVCDKWKTSYENFLSDVGRRPTPLHGLNLYPDRNGAYEPGNVRWATKREQVMVGANARTLEYQGQRKNMAVWSDETGVTQSNIGKRLKRGWSVAQALGFESTT